MKCAAGFACQLLVAALLAGVLAAQGETVAGAGDPALDPPAEVPEGAPAAMEHVDRNDLRRHAMHLASDELGGRYTGSPGQVAAASYIAEQFAALGLEPLGDRGRGGRSFLQEFPIEMTWLDPDTTDLKIGDDTLQNGFAVIAGKQGGKLSVSGPFVYCGAGAPAEIPGANLRRGIPVVVLSARGTGPRAGMRGSLALRHAEQVHAELERHGARCAIYCVLDDESGIGDSMNYSGLLPGKPIVHYGGGQDRSAQPYGDGPAIFLSAAPSRTLLQGLGVSVDQDGAVAAGEPRKLSGRVRVQVKHDAKARASNVVGYVEGTERKQEAIVFSAHMDHMGTRMDGDVFNGADDNASGSSGLLEIAQAFAKGERPRRSVIFLSVSGEEEGLWGSHWFSENPTWPLEQIVADINIDMIGRNTDETPQDAIGVTPTHEHGAYSTLVRRAHELAQQLGLRFTNADRYYERSDHYNFARKGVPVVFFCNGEHADYHKVTDEPDKLDFAKMERVARLAYWTGFAAADDAGRPRELGRERDW